MPRTKAKAKRRQAPKGSDPVDAFARGGEAGRRLRAGFDNPPGSPGPETVAAKRDDQALRQERQTFDRRRTESRWWFRLQFTMAITALLTVIAVAVTAMHVVWNPAAYSPGVVAAAAGTLFVNLLAVVAGTWKVMFAKSPPDLEPVTQATPRAQI